MSSKEGMPDNSELTLVPKGNPNNGTVMGAKIGTYKDAVANKLGMGTDTVVINEAGEVVYKKPSPDENSHQKAA